MPINGIQASAGLLPGTPTIGTATGGNGQATVTFTAPSYTGKGGTVTYRAVSNPGNLQATSTSSPIVVTGLTNGTSYTFTVRVETSYGVNGAFSAASNSTTPNVTLSAWTVSPALPDGNPVGVVGVGGMANQDSWWGNGFTQSFTSSQGGYRWTQSSNAWNFTQINRNDAFAAGMQRINANQATAATGFNWSGMSITSAMSGYASSSWGSRPFSYPNTNTTVGLASISGGIRYAGGEYNNTLSYSQDNPDGPFTQRTNFPVSDSGVYGIDTGTDGSGEGIFFPRTNSNVYSTPNHSSSTWTLRATQPETSSYRRDVSSNNTYIVYSPIGAPGSVIYTFNPSTNTFANVGTAPTTNSRFSIAFDRTSNRVRGVESETISASGRRHWFATLG